MPDLDPKIRLYTYAMSPFAAKVHGFLLYKQLDFECFYVNPLKVKRDLPVADKMARRQIPVLTIGEESRADSTPIGLWLDERFPDRPRLLPADETERKRLVDLDTWITNRLIPGSFRSYPGEGLDRIVNGWKLSSVMGRTARGGLPWALRAAWPFLITRVGFVRRQVAMAGDGLPVRESKLRLYDDFVERLEGGPFLAGRSEPSLPDLAAFPQFALYFLTGFRGGDDILGVPELMQWLGRMAPFVAGDPQLLPDRVRVRELPAG